MAITNDQVQAAVEKYLPRTVNYAQSADLGEKDQVSIFSRLMQVVLTAILLDVDSIFYVIYLASQRLNADINVGISALEALQSVDQLKGITEVPPTRIDDVTSLEKARVSLLQLSGAISEGDFGNVYFDDFVADITEFLTDQVKVNVQGRNRTAISRDIRTTMEVLASNWSAILERRIDVLSILPNYIASNVKSKVSADMVEAITDTINSLIATIPAQTTEAQADDAEQTLIDLAAAQAALEQVGDAPLVIGSTIVGPAADGFTDPTYLELEGTAISFPLATVTKGEDGELYFDVVVTGTAGSAKNDGGGLSTTTLFEDLTADFITDGVVVNDYLVVVRTGRTYQITAVAATELTLVPGVPLTVSAEKYIVMNNVPGTFFKDDNQEFWVEFAGAGDSGSSVVAQGTAGAFVRIDKTTGTDGTNLKASGIDGDERPKKTTGNTGSWDGVTLNLFTDLNAEFLTDFVSPADLLFVTAPPAAVVNKVVDTVLSQTQFTITSTFLLAHPVVTYHIEVPGAEALFRAASATFLTDGVVATDTLVIELGAYAGSYTIVNPVEQNQLTISGSPFVSPGILVPWNIPYTTGAPGVFTSATADFLSNNVVAGDSIHIVGGSTDAIFTILSVDSQTQVTFSGYISEALTGATYEVFSSATASTEFTQADGVDFVADGIGPLINGETGILTVAAVDYAIQGLDADSPTDTLSTLTDGPIGSPYVWSIRAGDTTTVFTDTTNAPFLDLDSLGDPLFQPGDILVIFPETVNEQRATISAIVSASELTVDPIPQGLLGVDYAIINLVKEGMVLVSSNRRADIQEVINKTRLRVFPVLSDAYGTDVQYQVLLPGVSLLTKRLIDLDQVSGGGFPASVIGTEIDLIAGRPLTGIVVGVADPDGDGFNEAIDVNLEIALGQRNIFYRLRTAVEGTTQQFKTAVALTTVLANDVLNVWEIDGQEVVQSTTSGPPNIMLVDKILASGLTAQNFVVTRNGSNEYGRYLLYDELAAGVSLDADTSALRLKVAEVLIDYGSVTSLIASGGVGGEVVDTGSGDGESASFRDATVDFVAAGAQFGDRLEIIFSDSTTERTFISVVDSTTEITVAPTVSIKTVTSWELRRNSVSAALVEAERLRQELLDLQAVVNAFTVPRNNAIEGVVSALRSQQLTRAIDLLLDGKILEFLGMGTEDGSYTARAKSLTQVGGSFVTGTDQTEINVAGIDPATGKTSSDAFVSGTSDAAVGLLEDVDTIIALGQGINRLAADELSVSAAQISLEEIRNRAIYELTGKVESNMVTDTDPTLPWISETGSRLDIIKETAENLISAIDFMLEHPDDFKETLVDES